MGQYFYLINLDKKQVVHAHQIGNGLKLGEQTGWKYSTETVAKHLIADADPKHALIGAWKGDRIGFAGDYGDSAAALDVSLDDEIKDTAEIIYSQCQECDDVPGRWTNISMQVREMMTALYGIQYVGEGWVEIRESDGAKVNPFLRPDLVVRTL